MHWSEIVEKVRQLDRSHLLTENQIHWSLWKHRELFVLVESGIYALGE